ncbi:MAG: hypothetical protein AAF569_02125 [Pseudomonadota bacterium]
MIFIASPAFAEPKPWEFGWWPGHYDRVFNRQFNPHLENGKHPHNNQYFGKEWFAEDWLAQYENDLDLINNFYEADIFHGQDEDDGVPVLIVGPNFYRLSGYDKRRVTHVLDVVYNITDGHEAGMFRLDDWRTDNPIGFYTEQGLQIQ